MVNKTGNMTNFASVNGTEFDYNETNNEDNETIIVNPAVDLSVVKNVDNSNPSYGEIITWIITVTNNGPDAASGIVVTDILPEGLIYVQSKASNGFYDSESGTWKINALDSNNSETIEIQCFVNKTGQITNVVTVEGNEFDYDQTNNIDYEFITVEKAVDLQITKIVDNSNPNYRDYVIWTLVIRNNGPDDATGVVVEDSIPQGLIGISDNSGGKYSNGIWDVGNLKSGETKRLEIVCMVDKTGDIVNIATITGNEADLDLSNNNASASINVKPAADLSVIKTSSKLEYVAGDLIEYTVIIKNNGPDTAHNVVVSDYLDNGLEFVSFYSNRGYFTNNGNEWRIDSLASGEYEVLTFKALAKNVGKVLNKVSAYCDEFDYNLSNNNASVEVIVKENIQNSIQPFSIVDNEEPTVSNVPEKKIVKGVQSMEKTGNPIATLILAFLILVSCSIRKM